MAWLPLAVVLIAMFTGIIMRSSVDSVAGDSTEMVETITHVDSADSLKTIIVTLNRQYVKAEDEWSTTLSVLTFLLFVVSVIALVMWGRLHSLWRKQQSDKS